MDNKINVDRLVYDAKKKEQVKYIIISVIGVVVFFGFWVFYFNNLESNNWRRFFTVVLVGLMILFFVYGIVKLVEVYYKEKKFRTVLTQYAMLIDKIKIPDKSLTTECLVSGTGRFGFDEINYRVWKENNELVFFPVRPEYNNAKKYNLVRVIRLNIKMIRSYYVTGKKFSEIEQVEQINDVNKNGNTNSIAETLEPIYEDTRATIIAYAVGDLTVYLIFSLNLYNLLKELIPGKNRKKFDNGEK